MLSSTTESHVSEYYPLLKYVTIFLKPLQKMMDGWKLTYQIEG